MLAAREALTKSLVRIESVISVLSVFSVIKMWRNVKALEEENKRLRKDRDEWVQRALAVSELLHTERAERHERLSRLQDTETLGTFFQK